MATLTPDAQLVFMHSTQKFVRVSRMSCTVCVCVVLGGGGDYRYNIAHFHCDVGSMSVPHSYSKLHFHQTVCNSESLIDLKEVTSTEVKVKVAT